MPVAESVISEQEKRQRCEQDESVLGTLAMEGLVVDPVSSDIGRRFNAGEMTLAEFSTAMQEHVAALSSAVRPIRSNVA